MLYLQELIKTFYEIEDYKFNNLAERYVCEYEYKKTGNTNCDIIELVYDVFIKNK